MTQSSQTLGKNWMNRIEKKYFHSAMLQNILSSTKFNTANRMMRKKVAKEFRRKYNLPEFSVSFVFQLNTFIF
jgi:hypothetical protein